MSYSNLIVTVVKSCLQTANSTLLCQWSNKVSQVFHLSCFSCTNNCEGIKWVGGGGGGGGGGNLLRDFRKWHTQTHIHTHTLYIIYSTLDGKHTSCINIINMWLMVKYRLYIYIHTHTHTLLTFFFTCSKGWVETSMGCVPKRLNNYFLN